MTRKVKKLLRFGFENNLKIISYGLAPNPDGFCFESHGKASQKVQKYFHNKLESLTESEIIKVKNAIF